MKANFGARKFRYAAGQLHCAAADACLDNIQDTIDMFSVLPFHLPMISQPQTPNVPSTSVELLGESNESMPLANELSKASKASSRPCIVSSTASTNKGNIISKTDLFEKILCGQ